MDSPSMRQSHRRSRHVSEHDRSRHANLSDPNRHLLQSRRSQSSTRSSPARVSQSSPSAHSPPLRHNLRKSLSGEKHPTHVTASPLSYQRGHPLAPIPGSPYATDNSPPATPSARKSGPSTPLNGRLTPQTDGSPKRKSVLLTPAELAPSNLSSAPPRNRKSTALVPYKPPQPQSLSAALEIIALQTPPSSEEKSHKREKSMENGQARSSTTTSSPSQHSQSSHSSSIKGKQRSRPRILTGTSDLQYTSTPPESPTSPFKSKGKWKSTIPPSPRRPMGSIPIIGRKVSEPMPVSLRGKEISSPVLAPAGEFCPFVFQSTALRIGALTSLLSLLRLRWL